MPGAETLRADIAVITTFKSLNNTHHYAIAEFVDNSVESYLTNKEALRSQTPMYKPRIDITVSQNEIEIFDNCGGISKDNEVRAFSVAAPNRADYIGTFGMGMKVSACWYTDTWTVETKALGENEKKMFSVNVPRMVKKNDGNLNRHTESSEGTSFTRISLKNMHRNPSGHEIKKIKDLLKSTYRFYLEQDIEITYNGEALKWDWPKVLEETHFTQDKKLFKKLKDEGAKPSEQRWHSFIPAGNEVKWITEIPEIDLGNGYKIHGGHAYITAKPKAPAMQYGFGIFWKNRLIQGHPEQPWLKKVIFGEKNQFGVAHLEGYFHLSSDYHGTQQRFSVAYTKNNIRWAGKEDILIEKLIAYLSDCPLVDDPNGKKYNFLWFVKNFRYIWAAEKEKKIREKEDKTTGGGLPPIITIPDPGEDEEGPDKPGGELTDEEKEKIKVMKTSYRGKNYLVEAVLIRDDHHPFVERISGPNDDKDPITVTIRVNLQHQFVKIHFAGENTRVITLLGLSFVLSSAIVDKKSLGKLCDVYNNILNSDEFLLLED